MMEILSNRKIKTVFCQALLLAGVFFTISAAVLIWMPNCAAAVVLIGFPLFGILLLMALYQYFQEQHHMMENAIGQIEEYLSGNHDARLECDDEGEVYKLFHNVNTLAAILNARAESEGKSKIFMKDTLSDISHQLKTPLAALHVYVGIIQEEARDIPTIQEFASLSEQELERIEVLVQNLLKIAKLDAGTILLERTEENIADMMGDIERHFSYRARQEGKTLLMSGSEAVSLSCDRSWFIEAISNLVKNAFDHTKNGDLIQVEWKESASVVQIKVSDNGNGIHPEDLYHIFKRFYRSRFSQETKGAGLGLPLSKTILEALGGTIEVDSVLGAGSTFTVNFLIPTKL